ncbi:MAG TPA: hypothetical protein VJA44_07270 [Acidimicrobiia bacterium]|nr:hypothetical protein [Acidimicrobiia bacterium]
MDIAVNLVESYLRLNGYLTLTEFEVQARNERGSFESVTDVDIMAIRFPGEVFAGDPHDGIEARMLAIADPALQLEPDQIDVILGEVKQGFAEFNPGLRRHVVLHSVLRRLQWLFAADLAQIVDELARRNLCMVPGRGGGMIRVRLVAFGRSDHNDLHTIGHGHIVTTMLGFLSGLDDAFRPVQFRDPAPAMLSLLLKTGFDVREHPRA